MTMQNKSRTRLDEEMSRGRDVIVANLTQRSGHGHVLQDAQPSSTSRDTALTSSRVVAARMRSIHLRVVSLVDS